MNAEEKLNIAVTNPDFLSISGSRLYGTDVLTSDYDYRGFTVPPFEYLIGVKGFNAIELEGDHKIYSLKRFIELILDSDPQCTELMFVPESLILKKTHLAELIILSGLNYALSNKIFSRIMGYSNGEWRKAMAIKLVPDKKKKEEPEILNDFWNCFDWLDRDQKEAIIKTVNENRPTKIVPSLSGLGSKRKGQVQDYGYCTKSAAHSIRLLNQASEVMLTGKISFPRPEADLLRSIRNGEVPKEDVEKIYNEARLKAEKNREKSILPDKPNANALWEEYRKIIWIEITNSEKNVIK